jgi:hypothetical protein
MVFRNPGEFPFLVTVQVALRLDRHGDLKEIKSRARHPFFSHRDVQNLHLRCRIPPPTFPFVCVVFRQLVLCSIGMFPLLAKPYRIAC